MQKNIYDIVKQLLAKHIDTEVENVNDETLLIDELNISSKQFISFILALQEEFGFDIDEDDGIFENMHTIASIVKYIETTLQK